MKSYDSNLRHDSTWLQFARAEQSLTSLEDHSIIYFKQFVDE